MMIIKWKCFPKLKTENENNVKYSRTAKEIKLSNSVKHVCESYALEEGKVSVCFACERSWDMLQFFNMIFLLMY